MASTCISNHAGRGRSRFSNLILQSSVGGLAPRCSDMSSITRTVGSIRTGLGSRLPNLSPTPGRLAAIPKTITSSWTSTRPDQLARYGRHGHRVSTLRIPPGTRDKTLASLDDLASTSARDDHCQWGARGAAPRFDS